MKSGMMVDRRDQVLMTCLVFFSFCTSTFFSRWSSTNGPFFRLRGISGYSWLPLARVFLAGAPASDDELVAGLVAPTSTPLRLAPRADRVTTTGGLALTTTVRMVHRVHHHTTHRRALALPAHPPGLTPVDVGLLGVTHLANRGAAAYVDATDLTAGHPQRRVSAFLAEQLDARTRRASKLCSPTRPQLHSVDQGTGRNIAQWQVIARLDVGVGAGLDHVTLRKTMRRNDVPLLAVQVVQQRDVRGAVGVILDVRDLRVDAVLVVAAKVNHPVGTLVPATLVASGDPAVRVASSTTVQRSNQRLLRSGASDLGEIGDAGTAATRSRRLVLANSHVCYVSLSPATPVLRTGRSACCRAPASRWRAWCSSACRIRPWCACACPGGWRCSPPPP